MPFVTIRIDKIHFAPILKCLENSIDEYPGHSEDEGITDAYNALNAAIAEAKS